MADHGRVNGSVDPSGYRTRDREDEPMFRVDTVPSRVGSRAVDYVVRDVSERIIFRTSSAAQADFVRVWAEDRALRASLA